jgi:ATP-binding cassette subfamily B (MDR/TAP) protein 1
MVNAAREVLFKFIYIGIAAFALGWVMISSWMISGERQANECRKVYFKTLL